ncbi:hypothetical protein [Nocardioides nitrophenolicus]|uniref:hypothetical protein n=1 Tax=Nocardioides nitrophenolicus TaxID=60489 RepID=UPI001958497D|nr:hypothetical protein [Nocardioides nitrophenolicus]MBM7519418.1 hypothetical protein [Nocardioides nitrophenolicus]
MPTTLRRHAITETPAVAAAIEAAARRWPEDRDRPARLLARLVDVGFHTIEVELDEAALKRQQALEEFAGSFTGVYWPGYLEEIREGWPE